MRYLTIRAMATGLALAMPGGLFAQASQQHSTTAAPVRAGSTRDGRPTGFTLGVYSVGVPGLTIGGGEGQGQNGAFNTSFGAGAGVTLGWGFNSVFSAFTSLDLAKQNTSPDDVPQGSWGLAHMEVGARANLPLGTVATIPYVTASFGGRSLAAQATFDDGGKTDVSLSGRYVGLGAGIEHAFSRTMAIDAGVDVGFGKFSQVKVGGDETTDDVDPTRSIRMRLGVTWRPKRGTLQ
jgi:hypothetical protein